MRKILIIIAALSLTGCATQFGERISTVISAAQNFEITQGQVDAARNSYDGFVLAPLNKYASLPRCKTGQKLTLNDPCHDRNLLKQIRSVDKDAAKLFIDTQNRITSGDNKGAVAAYQTLMSTIELGKSLIAQTGISVLGG
jgi:hypothetical protein